MYSYKKYLSSINFEKKYGYNLLILITINIPESVSLDSSSVELFSKLSYFFGFFLFLVGGRSILFCSAKIFASSEETNSASFSLLFAVSNESKEIVLKL